MKKNQRSERKYLGSWRLEDGERKNKRSPQSLERNEEGHEKTERKANTIEKGHKSTDKGHKTIPISHYHRICKPWIILPYGMYYNRELLTAKEGDILLFSDRVEREIEYLTPIKAETSYTNYLCKKTYQTSFAQLRERWKANLEFEGYNIQAINKDRVMLIYLKEEPERKKVGLKGKLRK